MDSLAKPKKKAVVILQEDESLQERCDWEMSNNKKIDPPEKQVLIEKLAEVEGSKTKRMKHAAEAFAVSMTTMYVWTKELNIEFGEDGKVIIPEAEIQKAEQQESSSGELDNDTREFDGVIKNEEPVQYEYLEDPNDQNELTLGVQPGNGQIHYPEEEFQLTNKMYRFGTLDIDVQYDKKRVVFADAETGVEIEISFTKVKAFANNMKIIGDEVEGGKA